MIRTDVHRPAVIATEDYEFVAFECIKIEGIGDCQVQLANREIIRSHMATTGGTYSRHAHGGNCMVCGNANAIYTALFHHLPTNSYVRMGSECADKVDMRLDRAAFTRFRDGIYQWREAQAGKRKAAAFLEERGLSRAWNLYVGDRIGEVKFEESTIFDMCSKLVRYGSISDKQTVFMGRLLTQIDERSSREAQRAAETAAAQPIPAEMNNSRVTIIGTMLSTKRVETAYGVTIKMLVKHADGWKVWSTLPSDLAADKGDTIEFQGRLEISDTDPKFGFVSRPTRARRVS